jgi:hypothetical protein
VDAISDAANGYNVAMPVLTDATQTFSKTLLSALNLAQDLKRAASIHVLNRAENYVISSVAWCSTTST